MDAILFKETWINHDDNGICWGLPCCDLYPRGIIRFAYSTWLLPTSICRMKVMVCITLLQFDRAYFYSSKDGFWLRADIFFLTYFWTINKQTNRLGLDCLSFISGFKVYFYPLGKSESAVLTSVVFGSEKLTLCPWSS